VTRSDIADAYATFDARGRPAIGIQFTLSGGKAFGLLTAGLARRGAALSTSGLAVNQHFAAVLDGKLLSVIFVNYRVYPRGIPALDGTDIAGDFSPLTANRLADAIATKPLPADLQLIRSTTFSRRVSAGSDLPAGATTARRRPVGAA
jgi:preprotein translocase subunit SecD